MSEIELARPKVTRTGACLGYKCICRGFDLGDSITGYVSCGCRHSQLVHAVTPAQSPGDTSAAQGSSAPEIARDSGVEGAGQPRLASASASASAAEGQSSSSELLVVQE